MSAAAAVRALDAVPASAAVTAGLLGGYATARATGVRPLGGAVLAAAGAVAAHRWWHRGGPAVTAGLAGLYVLGFGASHPLAGRIGAWPSVLAVTAANATANLVLVDRPGR
ncbi:hypothetical protein MRU69_15615 [Kocuria flava]|uniref:hypothetical protein n=1 Tax=Kocuria flava TaxID=446860 RepID=UPI001FF32371|nr:hypothetical protein [Kocuria flava]MCJ8506264.1 hypothetical protein [Kocuria flava]